MRYLTHLLLGACCAFASARLGYTQSSDLQNYMQSVPKISADSAIDRALKLSSLTRGSVPFHAVLTINEPKKSASLFQGKVEVLWVSAKKYRLTIDSKGFQQVRIVNGDQIEEQNVGDFYPTWLRDYVRVILDPIPDAYLFHGNKAPVMLGKSISQSCINRDDRPNGITDQMTWASLCFQGAAPQIRSAQDFTYSMEFADYQPFEKQEIARSYTTYHDGDTVVGHIMSLQRIDKVDESLFQLAHPTDPKDRIETSFVSMATNESLLENAPTIEWPAIREGKIEGNMIVHVITDKTGQVREAYRHNSDTPSLEDFGRQQALKYKFKPLTIDGIPRQMETPLVLHFKTKIGDPLPVLSGEDIAKYTSGCGYKPILPKGLLPSGTMFKIRISVTENGENAGIIFPPGIPEEVIQKAGLNEQGCKFKPYLVNGQKWYHHIDFVFTAP